MSERGTDFRQSLGYLSVDIWPFRSPWQQSATVTRPHRRGQDGCYHPVLLCWGSPSSPCQLWVNDVTTWWQITFLSSHILKANASRSRGHAFSFVDSSLSWMSCLHKPEYLTKSSFSIFGLSSTRKCGFTSLKMDIFGYDFQEIHLQCWHTDRWNWVYGLWWLIISCI